MKLNRKLVNILYGVLMIVAIVGVVLGTLKDQGLTYRIGDSNNGFGIIFTAFGVMGSLALGSYACSILFYNVNTKSKKANTWLKVIAVVAFLIMNFFDINESIKFANNPRLEENAEACKVLIITIILLLDLAGILFARWHTERFDKDAIIPVCLTIIAIALCFSAASEVIKAIASRPRPSVVALGEIPFRNWYEFKPFLCFKEGYGDCKSFASGHAMNAACSIIFLPLLFSLRKKTLKPFPTVLLMGVGALYAFVVGMSRVYAEAHYLSDVAAGVLFSLIIQLVVYNIVVAIMKKVDSKKLR